MQLELYHISNMKFSSSRFTAALEPPTQHTSGTGTSGHLVLSRLSADRDFDSIVFKIAAVPWHVQYHTS